MTTYEAYGNVCGSCGHKHKTIEAAWRCAEGHQRGIRSAYPSEYPTRAYSDRHVRRTDGEDLDEIEIDEIGRLYEEVE